MLQLCQNAGYFYDKSSIRLQQKFSKLFCYIRNNSDYSEYSTCQSWSALKLFSKSAFFLCVKYVLSEKAAIHRNLPFEPLSFHLSLLSSVCRVQVERKLTSSAVMCARLHCRPLELSFQRLLRTNNYCHLCLYWFSCWHSIEFWTLKKSRHLCGPTRNRSIRPCFPTEQKEEDL